ncbi:MAG: Stp1/IreP family PP2C-type Ser/Thr phosphatase [Bacillales bacterium]|nr:Stp1/IreP family PP2C-type Ser/Thr phosphatase [Bacillales bacterium]
MLSYAYKSDRGLVRDKNEDNACIIKFDSGDVLMMVLDGMGGHNKGEKASSMAMDIIIDEFKENNKFKTLFGIKNHLIKAIKKANREVNDLSVNNLQYQDMGTTLIAAYIHNNKVIMANIGDSRLYDISNQNISQISEDQTYVQFLYKTGKITKEDMKIHPKRHVLMNALGTYPSISIDLKVIDLPKDKLLLCSDGLYNMLTDIEINTLIQVEKTTDEKVDILIQKANERGGLDNIAIALLEVND